MCSEPCVHAVIKIVSALLKHHSEEDDEQSVLEQGYSPVHAVGY